jgi:subtilisin family serine protease
VVAILDTGTGTHDWLPDDIVDRTVSGLDATPIGLTGPDDPERFPDLLGPLDGAMDPVAGHGTFIAGIVRQSAPEADIVSIRAADAMGVVEESRLLLVLGQLRDLLATWRGGACRPARPIDVLNLSLSYYHETPVDQQYDLALYDVLRDFRRLGCVVIASAGNDAVDRPAFPAALWPWPDPRNRIKEDGFAPHVSVGALNPGGNTTALFSNVGPWVRAYAVGASVVSTSPAFETGLQALSHRDFDGRRREVGDPDDFRGGFAVWSGTSFAAPLVAGRIARELGTMLLDDATLASEQPGDLGTAVGRCISCTDAVIGALGTEDHSRVTVVP